ncbi:MAG TPA: ATP-dependent DNA helicase RecG [Gammaproteobacteria bacterium]|nr:ATP-dependent DNA helicase RecG [Gammaproteobacteria bacterium]
MRVPRCREPDLLELPVSSLKGVGPRLGPRLGKLGVERVADLLSLLPQRYEDRTCLKPLGALAAGEKALVEGGVDVAEVVFRRRRSLLVRICDSTGSVTLRFFHFSPGQRERLSRGVRLRCFGEVRAGAVGLEMVHPEYAVVGPDTGPPETTLTPVYPATEGLNQPRIRRLVRQALDAHARAPLPDYLDACLPEGWPRLDEAIVSLHEPPPGAAFAELAAGRHPWQRRLALEELVAHRLSLRRAALDLGSAERAPCVVDSSGRLDAFRGALPFRLTGAQERALDEILRDLAGDKPMNRLLQGDVGTGKTVVAAAAALAASGAGFQTAVMAPTELLAEQHAATFRKWLEPLGVAVAALSGSMSAAARAGALARIARDGTAVAVGTHALFQESVRFERLGLVIVDEQHRFGVQQRLELKRKGERDGRVPHQLVMTATPIPRTLAMTAYADLDCSIIAELPAGRRPVATAVMQERRRPELVERVGAHCRAGRQAYWVCPLIEESELVDSRAAIELERALTAALPGVRVGLVHGRMKGADKDAVMRAFASGALGLLVATTVIEVGVDVPNATLMVVENAERMGLAQLHQLRGRVGRGDEASTCVLLYKPPLTDVARARLELMRSTSDGFVIAEKDLELRGPGEVLGTRQTGLMQLRIADLVRDADLLPLAVRVSEELLERYPERVVPLIRRWVRSGREYASV